MALFVGDGVYTSDKLMSLLTERGYIFHSWTKDEIRVAVGSDVGSGTVDEWRKEGPKATLVFKVIRADSAIDKDSRFFHRFYKKAWEEDSVISYLGHAGLGWNLNLDAIEKKENFLIAPLRDRYQIFFPVSCSTYSYYTDNYWNRKKTTSDPKGSKNLDLFTSSAILSVEDGDDEIANLILAIDDWASGIATRSYQEIMTKLDPALAINGGEDNPFSP